MTKLKEKLNEKILGWRLRTKRLQKEYGDVVVDQVKIEQLLGEHVC
jgi:citrate synthase